MHFRTNKTVHPLQRMAQGRNGDRNALVRFIRPVGGVNDASSIVGASVQPGNTLVRQVRPLGPPLEPD